MNPILKPQQEYPFPGGSYLTSLGKHHSTQTPDEFIDNMYFYPELYPVTPIYKIIYRRAYCQTLQRQVQEELASAGIDAAVTVIPGRKSVVKVGRDPVSGLDFAQIYLGVVHELEELCEEGTEPYYKETILEYGQIDPGWKTRQSHPAWSGEGPLEWDERDALIVGEQLPESEDDDWIFEDADY